MSITALLAPDMDKKVRTKALEAEGKNFEARYLKSVRAFAGIRLLFPLSGRAGESRQPAEPLGEMLPDGGIFFRRERPPSVVIEG
jgi:hypothetical protein